jgi:hypothetical protein
MLESPASSATYAGEDLSRFRWHTGAALRPLAPDEACPILFRDLGPAALARFLRGTLPRLAGPLSPITYLRTAAFTEPYVDHEGIGRIIVLRPLALRPWHSGVPHVFVSRAAPGVDTDAIGFVPGALDLAAVGRRAAAMRSTAELREELGGSAYDDLTRAELERLDRLDAELEATEILAAPLRRRLKERDAGERRRARDAMAEVGLTENDLCAAWHHLPQPRREIIREALGRLGEASP